jgi:hypothetical protein
MWAALIWYIKGSGKGSFKNSSIKDWRLWDSQEEFWPMGFVNALT